MKHRLVCIFLSALIMSFASNAGALMRTANEAPLAFSMRVLRISEDADPHVTATAWNEAKFLFVDYLQGNDRQVVALEQTADGKYRQFFVTKGEEEGGSPDVAAIGFASSKSDKRDRLIVLLKWDVQHNDVSGTLYEVRIFDAADPSKDKLQFLADLSHHFDQHTCDCDRRDGKPEHFPFKTIAAIKAELRRMGS